MLRNRIDLHTHTTASDGSFSPKELIKYAKDKGLASIAITDHDTIAGIEEAVEAGGKYNIEVIPGIEISADFKPEMHILGYFNHKNYINVEVVLKRLRESRNKRNPKIIRKLNELGFKISFEEVEKEALGEIVARPHIAKILMEKGYVSSIKEAFDKYLGSGKPAYVKRDKLSPKEGIQEILNAGGVPVLAHPIHLDISNRELDELLLDLVSFGLKGMEVYYVDNTAKQTGDLLRLAIKHKLIATGGSDFHGRFKSDIDLGTGRGNLLVPDDCLIDLKQNLNWYS